MPTHKWAEPVREAAQEAQDLEGWKTAYEGAQEELERLRDKLFLLEEDLNAARVEIAWLRGRMASQ